MYNLSSKRPSKIFEQLKDKEDIIAVTFHMDRKKHKELKSYALDHDTSIKCVINKAIERYIN